MIRRPPKTRRNDRLVPYTPRFRSTASAAALKVFACESEWGWLLQELGGDHLDVYVATSALQDVHKIQPRPSLIAKYRQADLVVCTGSELEIEIGRASCRERVCTYV